MGLWCLKVYLINQLIYVISLTLSPTSLPIQGNLLRTHCFSYFFFIQTKDFAIIETPMENGILSPPF